MKIFDGMRIKVYYDDRHGWYAVKRDVLDELNIADKVSTYSYQKGKTVYLEEDADAVLFFDALKARGVNTWFEIEGAYPKTGISPIRSYESFKA